jgi:hypothetical protein
MRLGVNSREHVMGLLDEFNDVPTESRYKPPAEKRADHAFLLSGMTILFAILFLIIYTGRAIRFG